MLLLSRKCSFLQTNLHHSETATAQVRKWLEVNKTAVVLIQEPWVRAGKICGLSSREGKVLRCTEQVSPRACIFVTNNIVIQPLTEFCSRDLCAIRLTSKQAPGKAELVVASAYMPEKDDPPPLELRRLVQHCERTGLELIVGADSNAHHTLWGMNSCNNRGKDLVEFLFSTNLNVLNIGNEPTFVTRRSKTIIDLTLSTEPISSHIMNWHVSREASCSDHRWIRFDLVMTVESRQPNRNPRKTNRLTYTKQLNDQLNKQEFPVCSEGIQQIERQVNLLTDCMIDCYHNTCPLIYATNINTKQPPWWDGELESLRKKVRKLFNRAMNTSADTDWDNYKDTKAVYKKRIRFKKAATWRKFCCGIESCAQANRVRKIWAGKDSHGLGSLRKPDNTLTTTPEEARLVLLRTHFEDCRVNHDLTWSEDEVQPTENCWKTAYKTVTTDKTKWAVNSFHSFKAAGPDGVFPALLKWGGDKLIQALCNIFRACLAYRYIPERWREVEVLFIPKPGKNDYTNPKSFRPISLTSFLLKTLERMCDREIRDNALAKKPLHSMQQAYSEGKSTETALHSVVGKIEQALSCKLLCLGTFIDIEGAFDRTNFNSINDALVSHGVDTALIGWITNMLKYRTIRFAGDATQRATAVKGCPQGGVLSPLLWNMVVNGLISTLNANYFFTVGYADDLAILITGNFANTICDLTQSALHIVDKWCKKYGLSVNPSKTELIMFTNRRALGDFKLPTLRGTTLQLVTEVKYLGVILDSKLNWNRHLENKLNKACLIFWQCRRLVGKKWGLTPKITHWLYTAVIRPIISYCAVVWWTKVEQTTAITKLQRFQRLACVAITGCMSTTPTAAVEAMLDLPPLHLFIKQEAATTAVRLNTLQLWSNARLPHTAIMDKFVEDLPQLVAVNDRIPKQFVFDKKYKIQLHESPNEGLCPTDVRIFTDGSKTDTGTGAGVFSEDLNIKIFTPLGAHNSVFQAECIGISRAASAIAARRVTKHSVRILSDSKAVLQALDSNVINSGLILDCHRSLEKLCENNSITLQWIKGHSDSRGNDAADELARRGSEVTVYGPEPIVPLPYSRLRGMIRQRTKELHRANWGEHSHCRQAKEALPEIDSSLSSKLLKLKRHQLRLVTSALTGHGSFNKHLSVLGVTDSPLCRACMEREETAAHVLLECPAVAPYRATHLAMARTLPEVVRNTKGLLAFLEELRWLE